MRRRKKVESQDKDQSARFLETAKAIQTEDAKERFEKTCEKILKKKPSR